MGQLLTSSAKKCMRYDETPHFEHSMEDGYQLNQNQNDFGYLYYVQGGVTLNPIPTCIYEFDWYSDYDYSSMRYLCNEYGHKYDYDNMYEHNKSFDSEKLIHEDDYYSFDLDPSVIIYNNWGNWPGEEFRYYALDFGGGIRLKYTLPRFTHDNIYVYLTEGLDLRNFDKYDMTDPALLSWDWFTETGNFILRAYDMGDSYEWRYTDGTVTICALFNQIGLHDDTNIYSIFYGFFTYMYIYSSEGLFQGKTATVKKYNYYNQSTPIVTTYTFDHVDDHVGYNVIGFPIFSYNDPFNGPFTVNYYDIEIR